MKIPKVEFGFEIERDLWNIWDKSNCEVPYGAKFEIPETLKNICAGRSLEDCRGELVHCIAPLHNSPLLKEYISSVEKGWREVEIEYFKRANRIFQAELSRNPRAYLTTIPICPYSEEEFSFMFSFNHPIPLSVKTCGHEIFHLYFHEHYWKNVEKEIGKDKTSDLKEAVTVLLNTDSFKDLFPTVRDRGYPNHKALRAYITEQWKSSKDFPLLIEKCINYIGRKN